MSKFKKKNDKKLKKKTITKYKIIRKRNKIVKRTKE